MSKKYFYFIYAGLFGIALVLFIGFALPLFFDFDPNQMNLEEQLKGPSAKHIMGQDENGSDVLAKVSIGARVSLSVALFTVIFSAFIGLIIGSLSGFFGGKVDQIIMRFIDMVQAFPNFLLALALVAALGPSIKNLILAMVLTGWSGFARLVRGEVLYIKEKEFVQGARALGAGNFRQITKYIWPNLYGTLSVQATFAMAGAIITESGLSFLGLGAPPTTPTWGALLNSGRRFLEEAPHLSLFPGLAIIIFILGFNLLGDGLRAYLDPKSAS